MLRKDKKWIFIAAAVILAVYLLFANNIIALFTPSSARINKVALQEYTRAGGYAQLDLFHYGPDALETALFVGWAEPENSDYTDKKVYAILAGEQNAYCSQSAVLTKREDVAPFFAKQSQGNEGFSVKMSTLSISDGEYKLYILLDTDGHKSLLPTGRVYTKRGMYLSERSVTAVEAGVKPAEDNDMVNSVMTPIAQDGDYLSFEAQAYLPNANSNSAALYLELSLANGSVKWYALDTSASLAAVEQAQSLAVANSAFRVCVPIDDLPSGDILARIIVEYDGKCNRGPIVAGYTLS